MGEAELAPQTGSMEARFAARQLALRGKPVLAAHKQWVCCRATACSVNIFHSLQLVVSLVL
jgi:hypothetical protein